MKNILVATDYSENADFAVEYAAGLSKRLGACLTIFHAYHFPTSITSESYYDFWRYTKQNENDIKELGSIIRKKYKIQVETLAKQGLAVDEINSVVKEKKIDLVVMGINWDKFLSNIVGSTTSAMIQNAICPVLAIPVNTKFNTLSNMVLATDYNSQESFDFKLVEDIVKTTNAKLSILNVSNFEKLPNYDQTFSSLRLSKVLGDVHFDYDFVESDDVVEGILKYLNDKQPDVLVMLSRKRDVLEKLLKPSFTKKMMRKTFVPLLALPELH